MNERTTSILKISRETSSHFRFNLSIITPANKASSKPGAVADAIILPSSNSEPVCSRTIQLMAIRLKPKPINDITLPEKNNKNVLFFKSFIIINYLNKDAMNIEKYIVPIINIIGIVHFKKVTKK